MGERAAKPTWAPPPASASGPALAQPKAASALGSTPEVELSLGQLVQSDVRGNLGPAEVVTRGAPARDWLKDRWQAAKDMSGAPLPGEHWLSVDLGRAGAR